MGLIDVLLGSRCRSCGVRKAPMHIWVASAIMMVLSVLFIVAIFIIPNTLMSKLVGITYVRHYDSLESFTIDLVSGAESDAERIEVVNRWVFNNIAYEEPDGILDPTSLETFLSGIGVCRHKSRLMLSMLESIGVYYCHEANYILVVNDSFGGHSWVECDMGGYTLVCDPTNSQTCRAKDI